MGGQDFAGRSARLLAALALVLIPWPLHAQVVATLVPEEASVRPGKPLRVVLRLEEAPSWHTFWVNPGSGVATSIAWELPAGWTAGSIDWPVPAPLKDSEGRILGHGYTEILDLPVTITPSREAHAGETQTLKAHVEWMACAKRCAPGHAELSTALPVADGTPELNATIRAELSKMVMPEPLPGDWKLSAQRFGTEVTLTLIGHGGFRGPRFLSEDGYIQYDQPQKVRPVSGTLLFALPVNDKVIPAPSRLKGLLTYTDADGHYHGATVDLPIVDTKSEEPKKSE